MFKTKLQNHEEGFTLVEILVVILIVGILAAIAIPVFLNQRQKAAEASLISDTKGAATAIENYFASGKKMSDLIATAGSNNFSMTGTNTSATATPPWNSKFPEYKINISNGNSIFVRFVETPFSGWRAQEEGEFCLSATNPNTKLYAYPGSAPIRYGEVLYYDVKLGGITDFKNIVAAYKANQPTSCSGFAAGYITAGGT